MKKGIQKFEKIVENPRHPSVPVLIKPVFEDNLTCGPRIEPVFRPKGMALGACRSGIEGEMRQRGFAKNLSII